MKGLNETDTFIRYSHQAALRCEWDDLHCVLINSFSIWTLSSAADQEESAKQRMSVGVRDGEKERMSAGCKRTYAYVLSGVQQCANDLTAP